MFYLFVNFVFVFIFKFGLFVNFIGVLNICFFNDIINVKVFMLFYKDFIY